MMDWFHRRPGQGRCRRPRRRGLRGRLRGAAKVLPHDGNPAGTPACCPECRAAQDRERQYLQRLRGAAIPAASDDLTARVLARTEHLARLPASAHAGTDPASGYETPPGRRSDRPGLRMAGLATGGTAAAVALLAGAAYVLGGDAGPGREGLQAPVLSRGAAIPGTLISGMGPGAAYGPAGGWSMGGMPDFTPAGALTAGQLTELRSRGWTCPELRELGFHVIWARSAVVAGTDLVELRLTDGRHFATVLEQHAATLPESAGTEPQRHLQAPLPSAALPPENILTGHTAAADGFVAAEPDAYLPAGVDGAPAPDGRLWVNAAGSYQAIYQTGAATITYVSDLSADKADDALAALMAGPGAAAGGTVEPAAADIPDRMERGLGRLFGLLLP